jgi:hypothetical protein
MPSISIDLFPFWLHVLHYGRPTPVVIQKDAGTVKKIVKRVPGYPDPAGSFCLYYMDWFYGEAVDDIWLERYKE